MEQTIKQGDIVRLTDPISNGEIVRIESIDDHGFATWLGGSQAADMEQIKANVSFDSECSYYNTLSSFVSAIEQEFATDGYNVKLYPESAVSYWKNRAEVEKKEHAYYEQAWGKEHSKLLNAQDELCLCKKDILTLVNLIPCNEGNESIINDIKNILK